MSVLECAPNMDSEGAGGSVLGHVPAYTDAFKFVSLYRHRLTHDRIQSVHCKVYQMGSDWSWSNRTSAMSFS